MSRRDEQGTGGDEVVYDDEDVDDVVVDDDEPAPIGLPRVASPH